MSHHKIIIIEDDPVLSKSIENSLIKMQHTVTSVSTSGAAAIAEIEQTLPSLALISTSLCGDMNAIETAVIIRERFSIPVIFISADANEDLLKSVILAEPYGLLLKPLNDGELNANIVLSIHKHAMDQIIKRQKDLFLSIVEKRNTVDSIFVRADFRLNKIKFEDIMFVEALKDYVTIHTIDNQLTTHATMKEMLKVLPDKDFKRIHRSFIVRLDKIFTIKYPDLVLEGSMKTLPMGALYRKDVFKSLNII
jgi:two-component system, LytTR family, response regulator LytT